MKSLTRASALGATALLLAVLTACSSGSDGSDGAASSPSSPEGDFNQYAQCMRENGVDMPEDTGEGGTFMVGGEGEDAIDQETFEKANETCGDLLPEPTTEEQTEAEEASLKFAQCMREHGVEMPDPGTGGPGGGMQIEMGGDDQEAVTEAMEACGSVLTGESGTSESSK